MAKLFLIIVCVCYCTACIQLIAAQMAAAKEQHQTRAYDSPGASNGLTRDSELAATAYSAPDAANSDTIAKRSLRVKRHGAHGHHHHGTGVELDSFVDINPNTKQSIKDIFRHYGNGDAETMNIVEFERMVAELGLTRLIEQQQVDDDRHEHAAADPSDRHEHRDGKVLMALLAFKLSVKLCERWLNFN